MSRGLRYESQHCCPIETTGVQSRGVERSLPTTAAFRQGERVTMEIRVCLRETVLGWACLNGVLGQLPTTCTVPSKVRPLKTLPESWAMTKS